MNLKEYIREAFVGKFAIGAFGFYNLETAQAIAAGAQAKEKPVIFLVSEKSLKYAGFERIVTLAESFKKESEFPLFLFLDHGHDIKIIKECIKSGFDAVMFDGSQMPLEQNMLISKQLRQAAHRKGIVFEAEVGRIGGREDYQISQDFKTNPSEARHFYQEVKPDLLAVAIGNIHGEETRHEELDFTLLARIADLVQAPLVLHGCSDRLPREYQVAISQGVVKINIDTEARQSFVEGLKRGIGKKIHDPREILALAKEEMTKTISNKIEIFSCSTLKCSR